MSKIRLILSVALMAILLAACAGGGGAGTTTDVVPGTGVTEAPGVMPTEGTGDAGAGAATGECTGIDTATLVSSGETLYASQCAGCHGAAGEGTGDFPALNASQLVSGQDPVALVQAYFSVDAHPKTITTEDAAAIFTYVRTTFGGSTAAICPDVIQQVAPVP